MRDYINHEIVWIKDRIGSKVVDQWQVTVLLMICVERFVQICLFYDDKDVLHQGHKYCLCGKTRRMSLRSLMGQKETSLLSLP